MERDFRFLAHSNLGQWDFSPAGKLHALIDDFLFDNLL